VQVVKNVNLNIRRGEIVGIAGLMGAGRTEFAMSLFGRSYGQNISGRVSLHGKEIDVSTVEKAVANGIAYATEDRKTYGLVLAEDMRKNVTLAKLDGVSRTSSSTTSGSWRSPTTIGPRCASAVPACSRRP